MNRRRSARPGLTRIIGFSLLRALGASAFGFDAPCAPAAWVRAWVAFGRQ